MSENLSSLISERLSAFGPDPAYTFQRRTGNGQVTDLSGDALSRLATKLGEALKEVAGSGAPCIVLVLPPGPEFIIGLYAGLLKGLIVVPVAMPRRGPQAERFRHIVRDAGADIVLCREQEAEAIRQHLSGGEDATPVCRLVALREDLSIDVLTPDASTRPRDRDRSVLIQYTSGSTRMPKGVCVGEEQILANSRLVQRSWNIDSTTRFLNWCPHYHDMGLMGGIIYPLLLGVPSVQLSPLDVVRKPSLWLQALSDHKITATGGPAFMFSQCLERVEIDDLIGVDLSAISIFFCGAEPVPGNLLQRFADRFESLNLKSDSVFACYGMAEFCLFVAGEPGKQDWAGPIANPMVNTAPCRLSDLTKDKIRIVDPVTLKIVDDGASGEIWVSGPSTAQGYHAAAEQTAEVFGNLLAEGPADAEWLRTGDIGMVQDGCLYITGRAKDIVITNGRNISASEIEWLAASQHDALDAYAAAAFDLGSGLAVLMIECAGKPCAPEDLERAAGKIRRTALGEWGIDLSDILFLKRGTLDRTSSGKVRRLATAESYRAGHLPHPDRILHREHRQ